MLSLQFLLDLGCMFLHGAIACASLSSNSLIALLHPARLGENSPDSFILRAMGYRSGYFRYGYGLALNDSYRSYRGSPLRSPGFLLGGYGFLLLQPERDSQ